MRAQVGFPAWTPFNTLRAVGLWLKALYMQYSWWSRVWRCVEWRRLLLGWCSVNVRAFKWAYKAHVLWIPSAFAAYHVRALPAWFLHSHMVSRSERARLSGHFLSRIFHPANIQEFALGVWMGVDLHWSSGWVWAWALAWVVVKIQPQLILHSCEEFYTK